MSEYTKVKLGDLIVECNERCPDPQESDYDRFIGLEHMDTGKLKVKRYGTTDDVTTACKICHKGDLLFGRRNPYLRRAGIVDFDAACSGDIIVFRVASDRILPEYLPIVLATKRFWADAMSNQGGTMSKRVHYEDFAQYEFDLPDIKTQKKLSDLVWSYEQLIDDCNKQIVNLDLLIKSRFVEIFGDPVSNSKQWPTKTMKEVAPSKQIAVNVQEEGNWLLNLDAIQSNTGEVLFKNRVPSTELGGSVMAFTTEHVLYSKLRPYLNKVVIPDESGYGTTELIPLLPDSKVLTRTYLAHMLRSGAFVAKFSNAVAGTKMPRVSMDTFWKFPVPLPPLNLQNEFADFVKQVDKSKFKLNVYRNNLIALQIAVINGPKVVNS